MNATERMEAKVKIRNLEKERKFAEVHKLARESAARCWKMCDNHNHAIFEKLAERMKLKGEDQE